MNKSLLILLFIALTLALACLSHNCYPADLYYKIKFENTEYRSLEKEDEQFFWFKNDFKKETKSQKFLLEDKNQATVLRGSISLSARCDANDSYTTTDITNLTVKLENDNKFKQTIDEKTQTLHFELYPDEDSNEFSLILDYNNHFRTKNTYMFSQEDNL